MEQNRTTHYKLHNTTKPKSEVGEASIPPLNFHFFDEQVKHGNTLNKNTVAAFVLQC